VSQTLRVDSDDDHESPSKRVGTVVGDRYTLSRVIGAGGMGVVYEAQHTFTHRRVAVKVLHRDLAASPRASSRFMREARATASLGHPRIVEVFDGGRDADGALYLVEELLDGVDLAREVASREVSREELARLVIEALDGLAAAHARGLVHRDIKPENLFVVRDAEGVTHVKVLDFGVVLRIEGEGDDDLSSGISHLTRTGAIVGTPFFMSPEQAGGGEVDARTDLWAMGAVLFFALTGRHPVEADNYNALIVRLVTQPVAKVRALRPDVPEALAAVVDRALTRDLAHRWNSASEMASALAAFVDASKPALRSTIPSPVAKTSQAKSPRALVAAAFVAGSLVGVLGAHRPAPTRPQIAAPRVERAPPDAATSTAVSDEPVATPAPRWSTAAATPSPPDASAPVDASAQGVVMRPVRPRVPAAVAPLRTYE
jgi:eukaryotic-like serine/threonine-protein kinase